MMVTNWQQIRHSASTSGSKSGSGYNPIPQHEPDDVVEANTPRRQMLRMQNAESPHAVANSPINLVTHAASKAKSGPSDQLMQTIINTRKWVSPSSNVPTLEEALPWHARTPHVLTFEYWTKVTAQDMLDSTLMQTVTVLLIFGNAVIIGFETDVPDLARWDIIENVFLAAFSLELGMRMLVLGPTKFFQMTSNPDFTWNVFDFSIVAFGLVNLVANAFVDEKLKAGSNATIFRMARLLRILRVLRIIRIVRFLKQLYLLAYGFVEGAMAVFWVTLLASFALYICAVILVRTYGRISIDDDPNADFFETYFGSIPRTMFNLFELLCAPDLEVYHSIMFEYPSLVVFLVSFIILGSFGINGLLVALINESILEKNQARLEADRLERESKRKIMQQRCRELFDSIDVNNNRVLPRSEIIKCKDQIMLLFEASGVNFRSHDLDQMFYIMDVNDTGIIERTEFAQAVVELCDQIRPMSIMELHYQVSKCANKIEACDAKMDGVAKHIEELTEHGKGRAAMAKADQLGQQLQGILTQPSLSLPEVASQKMVQASAPFTRQRTPGDPSEMREFLKGHQRLMRDVRGRCEAILKATPPGNSSHDTSRDLVALAGTLFKLQQGTSEVLETLFMQASNAGSVGTVSRSSSWKTPWGRSVGSNAS